MSSSAPSLLRDIRKITNWVDEQKVEQKYKDVHVHENVCVLCVPLKAKNVGE